MQNGRPLYYLATMIPKDCEDDARILAHQNDREGWGFETIEISGNLMDVLEKCDPGGTFLLDSTTALLENKMFRPDGSVNDTAHIRLTEELISLAEKLCNIVIVSDYIYSDAIAYSELVEQYRKNLAYMDCRLAAFCDVVLEGCCGEVIRWR
jgi:adenosylcobinamide kinase/adenosylcobinamide-phosphate guanylyltransferase